MATTTKPAYDKDFVEWSSHTANLLRAGRLGEVDIEHVAEEIDDLGKRDRWAVHSQMMRVLLQQIKRRIQPERETASWRRTILNAQDRIAIRLKDSPSLKQFLEKELTDVYLGAVRSALLETGVKAPLPTQCPFTLHQLFQDFDLDWPSENIS